MTKQVIDQKIARKILAEVRECNDNNAVVLIHLALMEAELSGYKEGFKDATE